MKESFRFQNRAYGTVFEIPLANFAFDRRFHLPIRDATAFRAGMRFFVRAAHPRDRNVYAFRLGQDLRPLNETVERMHHVVRDGRSFHVDVRPRISAVVNCVQG